MFNTCTSVLPQWRPRYEPRLVYVWSIVEKVAMTQFFSPQVIGIPPVRIILTNVSRSHTDAALIRRTNGRSPEIFKQGMFVRESAAFERQVPSSNPTNVIKISPQHISQNNCKKLNKIQNSTQMFKFFHTLHTQLVHFQLPYLLHLSRLYLAASLLLSAGRAGTTCEPAE
jgi:hypothetical protein